MQLGELVADPAEHVGAHLAAVVGDDARAELDDYGAHAPQVMTRSAARADAGGRPGRTRVAARPDAVSDRAGSRGTPRHGRGIVGCGPGRRLRMLVPRPGLRDQLEDLG